MAHVTDKDFWDKTGEIPLRNLDLIYLYQILVIFNSRFKVKDAPVYWAVHLQEKIAAYFAKFGISKMPSEHDII